MDPRLVSVLGLHPHLLGRFHGHHGLRILILVGILAVIVTVVVLLARRAGGRRPDGGRGAGT